MQPALSICYFISHIVHILGLLFAYACGIIEELPRRKEACMSSNVFCVILEQPNGVSEIYFDDHDHMCRTQQAYQDMFRALKSTVNVDEKDIMLQNALTELEDSGYLMHYMEYPGAYPDQFDISEQMNGEKFRIFDGEPYEIDSIIVTELPIR